MLLFSLAALLFASPEPPGPAQMGAGEVVLVRAERLIVRPGEVLEGSAVLVDGGKIVAVGPGLSAPEGAREIQGQVVCAAFCNPWTSLGLDGGSVGDDKTTPATRTADSIDAWADSALRLEALRGGVTTARVQAGLKAPLGGLGALTRVDGELLASGVSEETGALVLGEACMGATIGVTRDGRTLDIFDRVAEVDKLISSLDKGQRYLEEEIEYRYELEAWHKEIAEQEKELEKDFKKAKKDRDKKKKEAEEKDKEFKEKKYKESKKPRAPKFDADDAALARVVDGRVPLVVEVHRAEEIRALLDQTEAFDRLRLVIAGGTEAAVLADRLVEREVPVICWPAPQGKARLDEMQEHDPALASELSEAGVTVLIGTGGSRPSRDLRLLAALAVGQGLDPEAALSAITQRPAAVFDAPQRLGTIERGKDADILVLDGDPLDASTQVQYVITNGRVVIEP